MVDVYTAAIVQYMRINPEDTPDVNKRKKANLEKVLGTFKSLEVWDQINPVKLVVFPENILRHEFNEENSNQRERVESAVYIPGPETDKLVEKAKKYGIYLSASIHEKDSEFPDYFFNTAFIMNPQGKIILKYRKINPWIPLELSTSPHDLLDEYNAPLFPVVKTKLGNLACYVCYDQFFPEVARQLTFNGAEILIKPTIFPPYPQHFMFDPYDWFTMVNKMRSIENMVYGINANGAKYGNSMIVDYLGRTLALAARGRSMTIGAEIDVEAMRNYRKNTKLHNLLKQFRAECYNYPDEKVWPANKPLIREEDYENWAPDPKFLAK